MTSDGTQHLLLAILERAVRDLHNADPRLRAEARHWLMKDSLCAEICENLGHNLSALQRTVELQSPPD
jgi:hypothetical protein